MTLQNGMEIEVRKSSYNKAILQPDGRTYKIDTDNVYWAYQFGMAKNYYDVDTKESVIDEIISDLQKTIEELRKMKEKEKAKEERA